ncbi:MAG TPA: Nramp family divalent metal transporter, partial [Pirellulaceae bacterium]|nr:Nramp family divalent metal transporter [Pirellulaceae bacterium]
MSDKAAATFNVPHPGSQAMPKWDAGELIDAPIVTWRNLLAMIGPGLVMGASAIGGGEWLAGPAVTAKYGGSLLWVATVSILFQVLYNIEISRYTLYTGEPIFTGKCRTLPGPMFWLVVYLLLDWGSIFPYLVANGAVPLEAMYLQRLPDHANIASDWWLHKWVCTGLYLLMMVPLIFGGKIYNSLKVVMGAKLVIVIGFLLFLGIFFSTPASWLDIFSGLFKFGTVPIQRGEDLNGNGTLDPGEDFDSDGHLDVNEFLPKSVDLDGDGRPDDWERDAKDKQIKGIDKDGDGKLDGNNVQNVFASMAERGTFPTIDFSMIAIIGALAAIAGNGGLTNTPISNFTRDQGWGMGHAVGAIPSVVGGQGVTLSHVGCVFDVNEATLPRWRRWVRHIVRDQTCVWMVACLIGVSLPSILSVEFLKRGTEASEWNGAALTAGGVQKQVTNPPAGVLAHETPLRSIISGEQLGKFFWGATLFCGFLVLCTSQTTTMDGFTRRWVDVVWTASPRMREFKTTAIKYVYFIVLVALTSLGLVILWVTEKPGFVFKVSTTGYNFALACSAWHTLAINTILLPKALRPNWFNRIGLILAGVFFTVLGILASIQLYNDKRLELLHEAAKATKIAAVSPAAKEMVTTTCQ